MEAATETRSHDVRPKAEIVIEAARAAVLTLLAEREAGTTICPSEVARKIATAASAYEEVDWGGVMPIVHDAVDQLVDQGKVSLSWKGKALPARSGPYRIASLSAASDCHSDTEQLD
jgi:hypothetical protein